MQRQLLEVRERGRQAEQACQAARDEAVQLRAQLQLLQTEQRAWQTKKQQMERLTKSMQDTLA